MDVPCPYCGERESQMFFKHKDYKDIRAMCRRCYMNDKDDLADSFDYHHITEIEKDDYIIHLVMDT